MHKITKGLKKKKKGKKSKHKDEELFKPEELEAYRREHQQQQLEEAEQGEAATTENDEWKKFKALTSGVDDILRKTQGDLNRIKSTSFFQRIPPPSEVKQKAEEKERAESKASKSEEKVETKDAAATEPVVVGLVETESEEEEQEDEDDIFDTTYIDALANAEVKLAYIPESPTEEAGDDPFDTSIAERAILGPAVDKRGKKLVPLGAAVEVLTGRVENFTCVPLKRPSSRRQYRQQDLLLSGFDDNGNAANLIVEEKVENKPKSLLDDDSVPNENVTIDLSDTSLIQKVCVASSQSVIEQNSSKQLVDEFDVLKAQDEEDDDEFAQLAAQSLTKEITAVSVLPVKLPPVPLEEKWEAFEGEPKKDNAIEEDPFDTTFAESILPGKAELKIIESEILGSEETEVVKSSVSIHISDSFGEHKFEERIDESDLKSLQPIHRDLLGGSNTDLSKLGNEPIAPTGPIEDSYIEYCDPFDTSIVDQVNVPGQVELKFLEKELLGDGDLKRSLSDPDFDPRKEEDKPTRPDLLVVNSSKSVAFALPSPSSRPDLLVVGSEDETKQKKPLTPYYVPENSIPDIEESQEVIDPFDTSFVSELAPGKAELKLIESELEGIELKPSPPKAVEVVELYKRPPSLPVQEKPDLLAVEEEVSTKVLTPAAETLEERLSYSDPFDTSIASNILPGKAELKLLENELIQHPSEIKRNLTDPDFDPRNGFEKEDLLGTESSVSVKPLTPLSSIDSKVSFDIGEEDIDPFDTSIAANIGPGPTELKLLESELI